MGTRSKRIPLTADLIISGYCDRVLLEKSQNRVFPNIYLGKWEADLLEITKAGYLYEYEVKISRHDFKIDSQKATYHYGTNIPKSRKYDVLQAGERVNYFSFLVPEGLIDPEEVPEWAGLIYARGYVDKIPVGSDKEGEIIYEERTGIFLSTIKKPRRLREEKISPKELEEINRKLYYRYHKIRCKLRGKKLITPFGVN